MEILGIGMQELIFIFIVALIIMGPKDMQKAGRTVGKWLRKIVTSDGWRIFQQTSRELRTLPNRLMREANEDLEQIQKEVKNTIGNPALSEPVILATPKGVPAAAKPEIESDPKQDA